MILYKMKQRNMIIFHFFNFFFPIIYLLLQFLVIYLRYTYIEISFT